METIKNYLETMFRNLPDTDQVRKAKRELLQMMEDKFSELRNDGVSENEAVGTVISEFGNLEELAADLGLEAVLNENKENLYRRSVSLDEIKEYFIARKNTVIMRIIAIALFITCCCPVILFGEISKNDVVGISLMFAFIAAGVVLFVLSSSKMEDWNFLKDEPCSLSPETIDYIISERKTFKNYHTYIHAAGILFCVLCFLPCIWFDDEFFPRLSEFSPLLLFVNVAIGVGLLVYASKTNETYDFLLNLNQDKTIGGSYSKKAKKGEVKYKNKTVKTIMEVFWPTITCIYLIWSFLTFSWELTWLIWPVAGVVSMTINNIFGEEE